jgi:hypothetical protein
MIFGYPYLDVMLDQKQRSRFELLPKHSQDAITNNQ